MNNSFDPEKSLLSLPVVHYIAITCLTLALAFSVPIVLACFSLPFVSSGDGINFFALQFKVPLGILALGLALIGLCGANHRSEQTKRQIQRTADQIARTDQQISLTRSQNNFSNYFKHIEEFEKYCESHLSEPKNKKAREIHARIFPNARNGDFKVSPDILVELIGQVSDLHSILVSIIEKLPDYWPENFIKILESKEILTKTFAVKSPPMNSASFKFNGSIYYIPNGTIEGLYLSAAHVVSNIDVMLNFDPQYSTPSVVELFLDWEKTADIDPKIKLLISDPIPLKSRG